MLLLIHCAVYIRGRGAVHFDMCIVHCAFVFVKPLHIWSGMREGDVRRSATFRLLNLMALIYPELILARRPWFESEGPKADIFASFASLRLPGRLHALLFMHQFETNMGLSRPRSESFCNFVAIDLEVYRPLLNVFQYHGMQRINFGHNLETDQNPNL